MVLFTKFESGFVFIFERKELLLRKFQQIYKLQIFRDCSLNKLFDTTSVLKENILGLNFKKRERSVFLNYGIVFTILEISKNIS